MEHEGKREGMYAERTERQLQCGAMNSRCERISEFAKWVELWKTAISELQKLEDKVNHRDRSRDVYGEVARCMELIQDCILINIELNLVAVLCTIAGKLLKII